MADGMDEQTMHMLRKAFAMADKSKSGFVAVTDVGASLRGAGLTCEPADLDDAIGRLEPGDDGKINFDGYLFLAAAFMEEDDIETITNELREAFRLYDKDDKGYITSKTLREILKELDNKITEKDMDEIIEDMDIGGKGRIDFEHFKALML